MRAEVGADSPHPLHDRREVHPPAVRDAHPRTRPASRTWAATRAEAMSALDGTHPTFRQSPPSNPRSTRATFAPSPAAPAAVTSPAVPPPITTRLYRRAGSGFTQSGGWVWESSRVSWASPGTVATVIGCPFGVG